MEYLQKAEQEKEKIFEILYLILLGIFVVMSFKDTTQIQYKWSNGFIMAMRILGVLVVIAKIAVGRQWKLWEAVLCCVICGSLMASWNAYPRTYILELAILIAGAYHVPFKKIVKVYFAVSLSCLLITMLLAGVGVVENLIYYRNSSKMRISFGCIYPTDFTAHVFFIAAMYAWIRERRISYVEIGGIGLLAVFCYWFCDARLNTICLLLLAVGLLYMKIRRKWARRRKVSYEMNRVLRIFLCAAMPVCAAVMFVLVFAFSKGSSIAYWVDGLLSSRLQLSLQGFQEYPITWFGQELTMWGLGGTTVYSGQYFFLDSSYVNVLLTMGIMVLISVGIVFVMGTGRECRRKNWEHLGILAVIALQCTVEHHLLQIAYNPFLLMLFALPSVYGGRRRYSKERTNSESGEENREKLEWMAENKD